MIEREYLVRHCNNAVDRALAALATFRQDLESNVFHAMEWSEAAFDATGSLRVNREILGLLDIAASVESIQARIFRSTVGHARNPGHSSSAASNLLREADTKAWADLAELFLS